MCRDALTCYLCNMFTELMHLSMWTERVTDVVKGTFFCLSSTLLDCIAAEIDLKILRDKVCSQLQELSDIHSEGGH